MREDVNYSAVPEVLPEGIPSKTCHKCRFNSCSKPVTLSHGMETFYAGSNPAGTNGSASGLEKVYDSKRVRIQKQKEVKADGPAVRAANITKPCRRMDTGAIPADPKRCSRFAWNATKIPCRKRNVDHLQIQKKS